MDRRFFVVQSDNRRRLAIPAFQHAQRSPGASGLGLEGRRLQSQCYDELGNGRFALWAGSSGMLTKSGVYVKATGVPEALLIAINTDPD